MIVPNSANALFVDESDQQTNREVQALLDEATIHYRIVPGCDWRGINPPWLFFSETGLTIYGTEGIKMFANLCHWHKVTGVLEATVGEERGKQWIEEPNKLLDGRTPLQAYKEGDAKSVFGICLATMEGAFL